MVMWIVPACVGGVLVLVSVYLARNECVFWWHMHALARIHAACHSDIKQGIFEWRWRYDALDEAASYKRMMRQWWRRLDSFVTPKLAAAMNPDKTNGDDGHAGNHDRDQ